MDGKDLGSYIRETSRKNNGLFKYRYKLNFGTAFQCCLGKGALLR